jgi:ADP-ribosyl-[dinitrogen reductase] hydrolase
MTSSPVHQDMPLLDRSKQDMPFCVHCLASQAQHTAGTCLSGRTRQSSVFAGITELPRPGVFTDDTQMTLFTAEGLISAVGQGLLRMPSSGEPPRLSDDATAILHQSYLRWLFTQQTGSRHKVYPRVQSSGWLSSHKGLHRREAPGMTCLGALASGEIGTRKVALNNSKGCGGVMRVAPAALIVHSAWPEESAERRAALAYEVGCCAAAITHSHPAGFQSGGVLAAILSYILSGEDLLPAIELSLKFLRMEDNHAETLKCVDLSVQLGLERKASLESRRDGTVSTVEEKKGQLIVADIERIGGGWIGEEALGIALYCCIVAGRDFESGLVWSVNHSGDSDSTGAIAGNILGALFGLESIPERWLNALDMRDLVNEVAEDLHSCSHDWASEQVRSGNYPPLIKEHSGTSA